MTDQPGRVHRLYVDTTLAPRARFDLPGEVAHHALRVLRLRDGDAVILFDGRGGEYEARLAVHGRDRVRAEAAERRDVERESPLRAVLVQAVSSGDKMDLTVQKAVELGVAEIHPVLGERAVVRLSGERGGKKAAHWRRIAIAACEQCGRNRIPAIREPVPVADYRPGPEAKLLLAPAATRRFVDLARGPLILAAGPEAGFSAGEERLLERAGFVPARLGPRVLRTETAALAALAALNALAGDF